MQAGDEHIWALGFPDWQEVVGRLSVADLHRQSQRCGIYVLGFANGERYVGRAVDVVRRFTQHRQTHDDITHLTFQRVKQADLNAVERQFIHALEARGMRLRNIERMSVVQGDRDLDLVVPPEEQEVWLTGDVSALQDDGARVQDEALRLRYRRRFERFMTLPHAQDALAVLGLYLQTVMPFPRRTELSFWSVSCLPDTGAPEGSTLLFRVNLNMQEVFSLFVEDSGLWASFHLAMSPLREELGEDWPQQIADLGWEMTNHAYAPGGQDQFNIFANGFADITGLLQSRLSSRAMALMNLRLMRKGPTYYSRYHCLDLVDAAERAFIARQTELSLDTQ